MSGLSTHILDTAKGKPASGVRIVLEFSSDGKTWSEVHQAETNSDGRVSSMLPAGQSLEKGVYRLTFDTSSYFAAGGVAGFYPYVPVVFEVKDPEQHYHVPLLLNPFGYSTYRGS
jgi:5-hydroxyisourate hydrolase